jgi:hypothetical protein
VRYPVKHAVQFFQHVANLGRTYPLPRPDEPRLLVANVDEALLDFSVRRLRSRRVPLQPGKTKSTNCNLKFSYVDEPFRHF